MMSEMCGVKRFRGRMGGHPQFVPCAVLALTATLLAACTAAPQSAPSEPPPVTSTAPTAPTGATEATGAARPTYEVTEPTVWLCHPNDPNNACLSDLVVTEVSANGSTSTAPLAVADDAPIDCFYVYPTVSAAPSVNAPRESAPEIVRTARAQASAFATECRLFVPIYRQVTVQGLVNGGLTDPEARNIAESDVVNAFNDYLNRDNDGRPFVLIGHSQGAMVLQSVIQSEIDGNDDLRDQLVAAMLIGGGPWLAADDTESGTFQNIPPCRAQGEVGCLLAYNTYAGPPPTTGIFGRTTDGRTVVCTNPGDVAGGRAALDAVVPAPTADGDVTELLRIDSAVVAECRQNRTHTWLDIQRPEGSLLPPTALTNGLGPDWGLHRLDVSLALGDLVRVVAHAA